MHPPGEGKQRRLAGTELKLRSRTHLIRRDQYPRL